MATRPWCPGTRRQPLEHIPGDDRGRSRSYLHRYGKSRCCVCRSWFVAHKDGTPVYHKSHPTNSVQNERNTES